MFIIDFIAGICISLLAGLGVGGGGLLVIYLVMLKDISQIEAQGINLLFFVVAGASSLIIHIKKRKLELKNIIVMIIFGSLGAVAGSFIANITDVTIVKKIFGGFLLISGLIELFSKSKKQENSEKT
ncbi:MAG: sulfite exporter TauE/SafE family protein [Oscillospiraceae bacterium]|nr:sulfite exporter TauE/SafE family protein [Oscillospiraceae bacterium]